jgi:serine protease
MEAIMKTFQIHLLALLTLAATLTACPDPVKDPPKVPDFTFSIVPVSSNLERNKTLQVAVSLNRVNNFADAVNVTLSNPAAGLSANPLSIDAASSSGNLIVQASSSAALGAAKLTVNALGGGLGKTQDLNLTVVEATALTPPIVTVDASLKPIIASIPGLNGGAPRPLASLSSRSGGQTDFVLNEMLIETDDISKLNALMSRWGGKIVQETNLDEIAKIFKTGAAKGPHYYLVQVDPAAADPAGLPANLQKLSKIATGDFSTSSLNALKFLSAVASEASSQGMNVGANLIINPTSIATGSTTEGTSGEAGFSSNAFTWDYMGSGAGFPMNTGVAQAWQQLEVAGRFANKVGVLVADGGFSPSITGPDLPPVTAFGATETPNPFPCVGAAGATGACPFHGSMVMSALAAVPDNGIGVAGPAGPVADLSFVQSPIASVGPGFDIGGVIRTIGNSLDYVAHLTDALARRPRVLNFSGAFKVDGGFGSLVTPLNGLFSFLKDSLGILTFAAAGNDGAIDVNAVSCYGIGSPSTCLGLVAESDVWVPCEVSAVICVGGLAQNATTKDSGSSFGSRQRFASETTDDAGSDDHSVDIYGPFSVWMGATPDNTAIRRASGTSFSTPFVAGVAALIWAADPSLSADQVQRILLETSHHTNNITGTIGGLRVNALGAIQRILGHPPTIAVSRFSVTPIVAGIAPLNRDFQIDAIASDPDGAADCCTITWTPAPSSEAGIVGGRRATFRFTTVGDKIITATARDTIGNTVSSSITISMLNNPPVASLSLPTTNITVFRGQPVLFRGFATDANEGSGSTPANLACNKLTWTSSSSSDTGFARTGVGTPPNCEFSYTFTTNGTRSISLNATDSQGLAAFAPPGRTINVIDPPANLPPNINLGTLPPFTYSDGYAWDVSIPIGASATDFENNTPINYRWTATTYSPNSATLFAGPKVIQDWSTTGNLKWTPSADTTKPSLFGDFTNFGNACYDGQTVKLVLEAKDSLGNTSSITLPNITVFVRSCILI